MTSGRNISTPYVGILGRYTVTDPQVTGSVGSESGFGCMIWVMKRPLMNGIAMMACAVLAASGGIIAWLTISSDVLHAEPEPGGAEPTAVLHEVSCGAPGPLLRPGREADCEPVAAEERVSVPSS